MKCPSCGLINPATATRCDCGFQFSGGGVESQNPEAAVTVNRDGSLGIAPAHSNSAVYREGQILIVADSATLLPNCVRCGKQAAGGLLTKTYYWHSPWWFLLILAGLLIYAIVALCIRKKARISFGLCKEHRRARTRMKWIAAGLLLAFMPVGIILVVLDFGGWAVLVMLAMIIVAAVAASIASGPLKPVRMDEGFARFRGADDSFLSLLPPPPANLQRAGSST